MAVKDLVRYNSHQIVEMLMNPDLRHRVRCQKNCSDWDLYHNPQWLMEEFFLSGMAEKYRKEHPND